MRRIAYHFLLAFCCVLAIYFLWTDFLATRIYHDHETPSEAVPTLANEWPPASSAPTQMIVMGRLSTENTDWVEENLPDWSSSIYVVDNTSAPVHTIRNKGREANAYLTFIIEHYHNLPNISVFIHSHRKGFPDAWHTDAIGHDIVRALRALDVSYIQKQGYVNLRCNPDPGCIGMIIEPKRNINAPEPLDRDAASEIAWLDAWPYLNFTKEEEAPQQIATACCAQFAVSREQILKRPLEDYVRYHQWLMGTMMPDELSGRIMEYSWHMIFGKEPVYCPDMYECYLYLYPGSNPYDPDGGQRESLTQSQGQSGKQGS